MINSNYILILIGIIICAGCAKNTYESTIELNTTKGYELYLKNYPESGHRIEISLRLKKLYNFQYNSYNRNNIKSLEGFIKKYPNNPNTEKANIEIAKLKELKYQKYLLSQ